MYYDGGFAIPRYIDKSWGVTSLRSLREIEDLRADHSRVWLVVAKGCRPGPLLPDSRSPQTPPKSAASAMLDFDVEDFSYLESAGKVMRETNCQELILLPGVPESNVARRNERGLLSVADRARESK